MPWRRATGAKKSFFMTTGAEAVENAIKVARAYTKRQAVIAFGGGFHGRTMMGMALTGKVAPYKIGFGPFPAEVYHAQFPCALHGVSVDDAMASIESIFKYDVEPARVAAIILEPVQGEGGFYVAPVEFVQRLRALCDQHGIVLIADEVQTGAGRTGTWLAMRTMGGRGPDIITMAKSLAGGFPLSAIIGRAEMMDAPGPGGLGGTYAGSPLGCAAALAVMDVPSRKSDLLQRWRRRGPAPEGTPAGPGRHSIDCSWPTSEAWAPWWPWSCARTATPTAPTPPWPRPWPRMPPSAA
jgi:4-aminobutyrate aminotransferase/(S)-3-amino-2-methylpropionate transaminase